MRMPSTISRRQFLWTTAGALAFTQIPGLLRAQASTGSDNSVTDFIHQEIAGESFPGAALLVHQDGKQVLEYFEGTYCNNTTRDNPVDREVLHMFHSFSKGISATVIAIARQKNLIDYDAPLKTYIPNYKGEWKDETTIRHLLTHTAGIPTVVKLYYNVYDNEGWDKAVNECCEAKVEWKPGSKSEYHARSAMLLAAEAVRSQIPGRPSWDAICREWLLDPIGAKSISFKVPETTAIAITPQPKNLPYPLSQMSNFGHPGAGGLGKLEDMIKVLQLHLNGGTWDGKIILDKENFEEMHRIQYREQIIKAQSENRKPDYESFGLGWKIKLNQKNDGFGLGNMTPEGTFGHAGIWTLMCVGIPQKKAAIAFVSTHSPTIQNLGRIRNGITDRAYNILK